MPKKTEIVVAPMERIRLLRSAREISGRRFVNSAFQLARVGVNCSQGMSDGLLRMTAGGLREVMIDADHGDAVIPHELLWKNTPADKVGDRIID